MTSLEAMNVNIKRFVDYLAIHGDQLPRDLVKKWVTVGAEISAFIMLKALERVMDAKEDK